MTIYKRQLMAGLALSTLALFGCNDKGGDAAVSGDSPELKTLDQRLSYAIGLDLAADIAGLPTAFRSDADMAAEQGMPCHDHSTAGNCLVLFCSALMLTSAFSMVSKYRLVGPVFANREAVFCIVLLLQRVERPPRLV